MKVKDGSMVGLCFDPGIQKAAAGKSQGAPGYSALFKELQGYLVRPSLKKKKGRPKKQRKGSYTSTGRTFL